MRRVSLVFSVLPDDPEALGLNTRSLLIDATNVERHTQDVKVANHPLETGTKQVNDHTQNKLTQYLVEGVISNTGPEELQKSDGPRLAPYRDRLSFASNFLNDATEKEVSLGTMKFGLLSPMVIKNYEIEFNGTTTDIDVSVELQEVRFAKFQEERLPPDKVQQETMASKCTCGTQPKNNAPSSKAEEIAKILKGDPESTIDTQQDSNLYQLGDDLNLSGGAS